MSDEETNDEDMGDNEMAGKAKLTGNPAKTPERAITDVAESGSEREPDHELRDFGKARPGKNGPPILGAVAEQKRGPAHGFILAIAMGLILWLVVITVLAKLL